MTRAEAVKGLRDRRSGYDSPDCYDALLDKAAADMLEADACEADQLIGDMAGARKDAAAAERARIRLALRDDLVERRAPESGVFVAYIADAIERVCGEANR